MAETKKEIIVENNELMDNELQDVSGGGKKLIRYFCSRCGMLSRVDVNEKYCKKCQAEMAMEQHADGE